MMAVCLKLKRGMIDSLTLYRALERENLLEEKPPFWWPGYGTYEVVLGAVLTQNANWNRVELSLQNLKVHDLCTPAALREVNIEKLQEYIRPSGLFRNKAKVLKTLSALLIDEFGDFESFTNTVERAWLLEQKGVGKETADSILCYACKRPVMVVDAYSFRLLSAQGIEMEVYDELQAWFMQGFEKQFSPTELPCIYAHYHGMIVEYVKKYKKSLTKVLL